MTDATCTKPADAVQRFLSSRLNFALHLLSRSGNRLAIVSSRRGAVAADREPLSHSHGGHVPVTLGQVVETQEIHDRPR